MPVVFITGGTRRIGRGLALGFAKHGYSVGITYRSSTAEAEATQEELTKLGVKCAIAQADVVDEESLAGAFQSLEKELGQPDVLVSNAGMFPPQRSVAELTEQALRETLNTNTTPLLTAARYLNEVSVTDPRDEARRLISISSLGGMEIWKQRIDYNTSKAAVITLMQALSRDLAPHITVNSVAPGAIVMEDQPSDTDNDVTGVKRIPMGRYGTAEDIFDAVWFFATATSYITGQTLVVDGGYHHVR